MLETPNRKTMRVVASLTAAAALAAGATPAIAGSGGVGPDGPGDRGDEGGRTSDGAFPIDGAHTYGDGLGAGRGHQGQDLIAKCGKPVVAAEGGRVVVKDYQASGAGNYVVISSRETKTDYVYMHMLRGLDVSKGDRVEAGERIGEVGTTGSSTTCHLHFEMWSAPGWYDGGEVIDPKPHLKRWDRANASRR